LGIIGYGNAIELKSGAAYQKVEGFELNAVMRRDISKVKSMQLGTISPRFMGKSIYTST
jgi:1,5-anhydro-D-fructose reductase (1,5-anhydro-D-mannitol-forming)